MKFSSLPTLFLICTFVGISSCKSVKEPELKGIGNFKMDKLSLVNPEVRIDLRYFNPNNYNIKIKKAEGDAWLNNHPLGHFTLDTLIHVDAQSDFTLPVNLTMDVGNLPQNASLLLLAKEVTLKVVATARVGKGLLFINYPIMYEGKQDLKELLHAGRP